MKLEEWILKLEFQRHKEQERNLEKERKGTKSKLNIEEIWIELERSSLKMELKDNVTTTKEIWGIIWGLEKLYEILKECSSNIYSWVRYLSNDAGV